MSGLKFYKVLSLPKVLVPNAIYLVADKKSETVQIFVANKEGSGVLGIVNEAHIRSIIRDELFISPVRPKNYKKNLIYILLFVLFISSLMYYWLQLPKLPIYDIKRVPIERTIKATGYVENVPISQVESKFSGLVREVQVKQGESLHSNQTLLKFQANELDKQITNIENQLNANLERKKQQAKLDMEMAKLQLLQAKSETKRHRQPIVSAEENERYKIAQRIAEKKLHFAELQIRNVNVYDLEELKLKVQLSSLKKELSTTTIRSKREGVILSRNVEVGDWVEPGNILFTIAYNDEIKIKARFDERDLSQISMQQEAMVVADAYPDQPFFAKISFISPRIELEKGTVEVWLSIEKPPKFLRQNMNVTLKLEAEQKAKTGSSALIIPNSALTNVYGNHANVIVVNFGKVKHENITLGFRGHSSSEVVSGLREGDRVLMNPIFPLKNGERIRTESYAYLKP
jgi:HlyD family secretion protein